MSCVLTCFIVASSCRPPWSYWWAFSLLKLLWLMSKKGLLIFLIAIINLPILGCQGSWVFIYEGIWNRVFGCILVALLCSPIPITLNFFTAMFFSGSLIFFMSLSSACSPQDIGPPWDGLSKPCLQCFPSLLIASPPLGDPSGRWFICTPFALRTPSLLDD